MVCVKLSRECNTHKRDNLVDAAGYAAVAMRIIERQEDRRLAAETPERTTDRK
jgi:hypothetical protein